MLVSLNKDLHEYTRQKLMILPTFCKAHYISLHNVCMFTDNLTASNRYGWVHESRRFISSSSLETSTLGWRILYGLQCLMHDQAMYHGCFLSIMQSTTLFKFSIQPVRGRKKDCKTSPFSCIVDVFFLCLLSSTRKEYHLCTEQARVIFWFVDWPT